MTATARLTALIAAAFVYAPFAAIMLAQAAQMV
jgi:hypothetical protein